jgi:hypothetical protein
LEAQTDEAVPNYVQRSPCLPLNSPPPCHDSNCKDPQEDCLINVDQDELNRLAKLMISSHRGAWHELLLAAIAEKDEKWFPSTLVGFFWVA